MSSSPIKEDEGIHKDHRKRVREKLLKNDGGFFPDHELLEAVLFYVIPRADTNPISHKLLQRFSNLKGVFSADMEDLIQVPGCGTAVALYIKTWGEIFRKSLTEKFAIFKLANVFQVAEFCKNLFQLEPKETFIAICVDGRENFLQTSILSNGKGLSEATVDVDYAFSRIYSTNTKYVVLTHNHISDGLTPSTNDLVITKIIAEKLFNHGITVSDHVIVNNGQTYSMRSYGIIDKIYQIIKKPKGIIESTNKFTEAQELGYGKKIASPDNANDFSLNMFEPDC